MSFTHASFVGLSKGLLCRRTSSSTFLFTVWLWLRMLKRSTGCAVSSPLTYHRMYPWHCSNITPKIHRAIVCSSFSMEPHSPTGTTATPRCAAMENTRRPTFLLPPGDTQVQRCARTDQEPARTPQTKYPRECLTGTLHSPSPGILFSGCLTSAASRRYLTMFMRRGTSSVRYVKRCDRTRLRHPR